MLPPHASVVAAATCAAASLGSAPAVGAERASVNAAAQLAHHAALDCRAALSRRCSLRRRHRLLARALRRLGYSYALTACLLTDHVPAGAAAGAIFSGEAATVAGDSAELARRAGGRLQAHAVRVLRRTSRLQADVAFELGTARSSGSIEDLHDVLSATLRAHDALLAALRATVATDALARRHRGALEASGARATAAREALRAALVNARAAVQDAARDDQADIN